MRNAPSFIVLTIAASIGAACLSTGSAEPQEPSATPSSLHENPPPASADGPLSRSSAPNPEELGDVGWFRSLEHGMERSEATGKPIFLLFTEVPGCSTVKGFANGPLSHPLVVEAIEGEFVPVAIYNNVDGYDREVLERYDEPTWNNPVVRFVDRRGDDVAPRYGADWTERTLVPAMITALEASERGVPNYLRIFADERAANLQTTTF